jgi:hypothetical protein
VGPERRGQPRRVGAHAGGHTYGPGKSVSCCCAARYPAFVKPGVASRVAAPSHAQRLPPCNLSFACSDLGWGFSSMRQTWDGPGLERCLELESSYTFPHRRPCGPGTLEDWLKWAEALEVNFDWERVSPSFVLRDRSKLVCMCRSQKSSLGKLWKLRTPCSHCLYTL